ncbi:MAG: crotonase/enoyl-CoA hydratase family protein [Myxococcota bacterium]
MSDFVRYERDDHVATLTMDDGKANALGPDMIAAVDAALDRAENEDAQAIVLAGRPGRFCAGFDLRVLTSGADKARPLVMAGSALFTRLYGFPRPVVAACTGHAVAGGALLLLGADHRIGARGSFKLGLNEVAIGIELPVLVREMAAARLDNRYHTEALLFGTLYDPDDAVSVGYLDESADDDELRARATARAKELTKLPRRAFAASKGNLRGPAIERIRANMEQDLDRILAAEPKVG